VGSIVGDRVPAGFLAGAGDLLVQLDMPRGTGSSCVCCSLLAGARGAGAGGVTVRATLSADGDAMAFWSEGAEGWELCASVPRSRLGCHQDAALDALHELAQSARALYSARLAAPASGAAPPPPAAARSAPECEQSSEPCQHAVVFTVHLALSLFDSKPAARDAQAGRCLRRVLSRFSGEAAIQSRGAAESRELEAMRRAAQCLGLAPGADAMHAFLDFPLLPGQASRLHGKFRLEQVLQSIVEPSSNDSQQRCGDTDQAASSRDPQQECAGDANRAPAPQIKAEIDPDPKGKRAMSPQIKAENYPDPKGKRAISPDRQPRSARRVSALLSVPEDALVQMLELLEPLQLDAISLVCKSMHAAARICVPGLRLKLYKHQRRAMETMMAREKSQILKSTLYSEPYIVNLLGH
jgi:hypothetical protein